MLELTTIYELRYTNLGYTEITSLGHMEYPHGAGRIFTTRNAWPGLIGFVVYD